MLGWIGRPTGEAGPEEEAVVAVTRLGLGARIGEVEVVGPDARDWLHGQIKLSGAPQPPALPGSAETLASLAALGAEESPGQFEHALAFARREASARVELQIATPAGFAERWALFWINYFSVRADRPETLACAGPYEREAIRPRVFGRFEDLAMAALTHPAMLFYYDQTGSAGPNSAHAKRRGGGFNENLGREILELYTVGRGAGYRQADVTETALALTGWCVAEAGESGAHAFSFRRDLHEPGPRHVMGKVFPSAGVAQPESVVRALAAHPATGRRLAYKIARHFVADAPPSMLVERLAETFRASGGSLAEVAHALVEAPETWRPEAAKFKTPYELYISTSRCLDRRPSHDREPGDTTVFMDQGLWQAPSPKGWPDVAAAWSSSGALARRIAWVRAACAEKPRDVEALARSALGPRLRRETRGALDRAGGEGAALLFLSPEFQWR